MSIPRCGAGLVGNRSIHFIQIQQCQLLGCGVGLVGNKAGDKPSRTWLFVFFICLGSLQCNKKQLEYKCRQVMLETL